MATPHTGKIAHPRELAELIATRYPDRIAHVVADAAYLGERLRNLQNPITRTSRLKVTSVLHELPPPRTGRLRATAHQRAPVGHAHRPCRQRHTACRQRHTDGPVA